MEVSSEATTFLNSDVFKLSFDSLAEDATYPWFSVIRNLNCQQIESLHAIFKEKAYRQKLNNEKVDQGLSKEEFVKAIDEVYGCARYSVQAILLFEEIDKSNKRYIKWIDFIDFMIEKSDLKPNQGLELIISQITTVPHVKRETIVKMVLIETETFFCYAIISKYGHVGLYDGNLNFLTSYHAIMTREDITRKNQDRRRRNRWITDAVFCVDALMFLITNTTRSIMIYDASGLKHMPLWLVMGFPNVVNCLSYYIDRPNEKSILFMGDDIGKIYSLGFLHPKKGFFRRKQNDKLTTLYWQEILDEAKYVTIKKYGKVHNDVVQMVQYFDVFESIVSCSKDATASVSIRHIANKTKPYVFKMHRGASRFALSQISKMLITGSEDGAIRIWNYVVPSNPVAVFTNHRNSIVDIQIFENQNLFLTCSSDGVLKLWSTNDYVCLQTMKLRYPVFNVHGKKIEWGKDAIYPGPKRMLDSNVEEVILNLSNDENDITSTRDESFHSSDVNENQDIWERSNIWITCCNYIAKIKLNFLEISLQSDCDMTVLPPPPLQNNVLIPTTWKICEDIEEVPNEKTHAVEDNDIKYDDVEQHIQDLKFILEKNFVSENGLVDDINYKLATIDRKKSEMQWAVSKGAPYLAMDLFDINEITLPSDLPVPQDKSLIKLVDKIRKMLSNANTKDQLFSEPLSSRSRSSRSSIVEFDF